MTTIEKPLTKKTAQLLVESWAWGDVKWTTRRHDVVLILSSYLTFRHVQAKNPITGKRGWLVVRI